MKSTPAYYLVKNRFYFNIWLKTSKLNSFGYIPFVGHKTQCPQIYIKLTLFEDNGIRNIPFKYYLLGCCMPLDKLVKQCHTQKFVSGDEHYFSMSNVFSWHCFTHFSKTTSPRQVIFQGKLSTITIFKLWQINVNLRTLCFVLQKVKYTFGFLNQSVVLILINVYT